MEWVSLLSGMTDEAFKGAVIVLLFVIHRDMRELTRTVREHDSILVRFNMKKGAVA